MLLNASVMKVRAALFARCRATSGVPPPAAHRIVRKPHHSSTEDVWIFVCKADKSLPAGQAIDFILQMNSGKAILVENRELVHRGLPVIQRTTPVSRDIAQGQPPQFGRGLVGREVPTRLDDLA